MSEQKQPWYISSTGEGLAMRVQGALTALIPLILIACKYFKVEIGTGEIKTLIDAIQALILVVFGAISAFMVVYGQARAILIKIQNRNK